MRLPAGGQHQLQTGGIVGPAQCYHQRGELGAGADWDALQNLEIIDGVHRLDVILWCRPLLAEAVMGRVAHHSELEIEAAKRLAAEAKSMMQLRESQAILVPALTGASLEMTAEIPGLGRNRVCVLPRQFRASGRQGVAAQEKRGGRRHQLMTVEQEIAFLAPRVEKAAEGVVLIVPPIHAALELAVGHRVPKSTV